METGKNSEKEYEIRILNKDDFTCVEKIFKRIVKKMSEPRQICKWYDEYPACRIDAGSLKTDMNLIRLKNPVNFDHEEHDPVRYVCCLSAADQKTHLRAFFNLVNILQNPAFLPALDQASTPLEAARTIEKFEYELS